MPPLTGDGTSPADILRLKQMERAYYELGPQVAKLSEENKRLVTQQEQANRVKVGLCVGSSYSPLLFIIITV